MVQDNLNNHTPFVPDSDPFYKKLVRCYYLGILYRYSEQDIARIESTPVLSQILEFFQKKMARELKYPLRYVLYSAHDDTIAGQLVNLGYYNTTCYKDALIQDLAQDNCKIAPPVASNIVWELLNENFQFNTRVSYNGEYLDFCNLGNSDVFYECPMDTFIEKVQKKYTIERVHDLCGVTVRTDASGLSDNQDNLIKSEGNSFNWEDVKNSLLVFMLILLAIFGTIIGFLALELAKIKKNVVQMDEELGRDSKNDSNQEEQKGGSHQHKGTFLGDLEIRNLKNNLKEL